MNKGALSVLLDYELVAFYLNSVTSVGDEEKIGRIVVFEAISVE